MRHGIGSAYYPDGSLKYTGTWKYSYPNGVGTAYYSTYDQDHLTKENFVVQSLHGIFKNGVFVGNAPTQDTKTRKLFLDGSSWKSQKFIDNMNWYLMTAISSFYGIVASTVNIIATKLPDLIKILG